MWVEDFSESHLTTEGKKNKLRIVVVVVVVVELPSMHWSVVTDEDFAFFQELLVLADSVELWLCCRC